MTKLCPRGKAAAKRKFKVYPSAYANAYASKICAGKIKDTVKTAKPDNKGQKLTPEQSEKVKRGIKGIKEKIAPKKKMDRLEELRKELK